MYTKMLEPPELKAASVEQNMDRLREPVRRVRGWSLEIRRID